MEESSFWMRVERLLVGGGDRCIWWRRTWRVGGKRKFWLFVCLFDHVKYWHWRQLEGVCGRGSEIFARSLIIPFSRFSLGEVCSDCHCRSVVSANALLSS